MSQARKFARVLLWSAAVVLAIPLFLSLLYLYQGSLEMFPTEEKQEQVRTVAGVMVLIFAGLECLVAVGLWRLK